MKAINRFNVSAYEPDDKLGVPQYNLSKKEIDRDYSTLEEAQEKARQIKAEHPTWLVMIQDWETDDLDIIKDGGEVLVRIST